MENVTSAERAPVPEAPPQDVTTELKVTVGELTEEILNTLGIRDKMFAIQKYIKRARLAVGGEKKLEKEFQMFAAGWILDAVEKEHKRIETMLREQEKNESRELFDLLVAKGIPLQNAYETAFGITKSPAMPPLPRVAVAAK